METNLIMALAIVAVAFIASAMPIFGLFIMALASLKWVGLWPAIVVTLFWVRYGAPLWPVSWPWGPK